MNKFLLFLSLVVYVECNGLRDLSQTSLSNGGYGRDSGYGIVSGYGSDSGYGSALAYQQPQSYQSYQPQPQPKIVEVENVDVPIKVLFRARSPKIEVQQVNIPGERGTVQKTRTEEEPHRLEHEVYRPVIQEVREIIQPYRRVVQEVRPVIEQVTTQVARGDGRANNLGNAQGLGLGSNLGGLNGQLQYSSGNNQYEGQRLQLSAPIQYNTASLEDIPSADYGSQSPTYGQLTQLWSNAKALSRSRAASS